MTGKQSTGEKSKSTPGNARNIDSKPQSSRMPHMVTRLAISDLNQHLTCALCSGYMIDATTVVECLHSFCRSCLLRYLETSSTCPICDTQINKAQLDKCVRADHTLQDLVYKLVPGLYKNELRRRKDFYLEQCKSAADYLPSSSSSSVKSDAVVTGGMQIFDKHLVELSAFICTPDEIISFSLESAPRKMQQSDLQGKCTVQSQQPSESDVTQPQKAKEIAKKTEDVHFKRYFRCPAAVTVGHLKKLLVCKMDLSSSHQVEILHSDEPLLDEYTLMDIAYIYTWRRKAPMQLFFNICKYESEDEPMPLLVPEVAAPATPSTSSQNPPAPTTTSSLDVKEDITTQPAAAQPRLLDSVGANAAKKSSNHVKKDISSNACSSERTNCDEISTHNFSTNNSDTPGRELNSVRDVLKLACRPNQSPLTSLETSMRGKPPLPIHQSLDQLNGVSHRTSTPTANGKMPPIRLALGASANHRKRKTKNEADTPKQTKPRKTKATKLASSAPTVLAALQKITNMVPLAAITSAASIHKPTLAPLAIPTPMNQITIDTNVDVNRRSSSPTSIRSESNVSPLSSPFGSYKPTAAQSACTQPAKLRLKKSLSSVVQELSSNALGSCSPSKKSKLQNGTEEDGVALIH